MNSKQQLIDSLTSHISLYSSQTRHANPNSNNRTSIIRWFESLSVEQRRAHLTIVDSNFVAILLLMNQRLRTDGPGRFILLPDLPQNDGSSLPSVCYRKSEGLLKRSLETNVNRVIRDSVQIFSSIEGDCVGKSENCGIRKVDECGDAKLGRGDFMVGKNIKSRNGRFSKNDCCISSFTEGDTLKLKKSSVLRRNSGSTVDTKVKSNCTRNMSFDAVCMCEVLVEDVGRFVMIMDEITSGEFLRIGEEAELFGQWVETAWLKGKGYYSLEEFVVNRVEVALRLAWLSSCGGGIGKKRGLKLKEKLGGVGLAGNVFWRKKGCIDWWEKLEGSMKKKVYCVLLGKTALDMTLDMVDGKYQILDEEFRCYDNQDKKILRHASISSGGRSHRIFNGPCSEIKGSADVKHDSRNPLRIDGIFNGLYILQVICSMVIEAQQGGYDKEKLFFSSLDSVNTISDIILRKLRELIMVVSLDCTKHELLGEINMSSTEKKVTEKHVGNNRKKKGKNQNKKPKPIPRPLDDPKPIEISKVKGDGILIVDKQDTGQFSKLEDLASKGDLAQGRMPSDDMETNKGVNNGKSRSVSRKSRKERKIKNSKSSISEVASSQSVYVDVSSSSIIIPESPLASESTSVKPSCETESNNVLPCASILDADPTLCSDSDIVSSAQLGQRDSAKTNIRDTNKIHAGKQMNRGEPEASPTLVGEQGGLGVLRVGDMSSQAYNSYEWPNITPAHPANAHLPAATDRLHLDVGHNLQNYFHHSFLHPLHVRNSSIDNAYKGTLSRPFPMSLDWAPSVRARKRVSSVTCSYGSEFIAMRQSSFQQSIMDQSLQSAMASSEDEQTVSCEVVDLPDLTNSQDLANEHENQWMSEEKLEAHAISGMDYSQYFGGGVMYWNPSDHPGTSLSRPPSLCSDDSSWGWREADMSRTVDEMVAFSSSYSTNGLTSPSAASFCSPFDPLASGTLGYVLPGGEINSKILQSSAATDISVEESASGSISDMSIDIEVKSVDSLPYPVLRPIIIPNMSRERSRSDFKRGYDHKSPCVPPNRREHPRIKRPPSPVVLCVPRAPNPPPPSPVGDSRKHRGFPTVRSGSSSPRHWGVKGWFHDGGDFDEACMPMEGSEAVWASWRNKSLSARQLTQPLAGSLIQDRLIAISHLTRDQEHPDVTFPLQPPESQNCSANKASVSLLQDILHDEIDSFCKQVAAENLIRKPYISWAVKRVARSLQVLWPRSRTNIFGSNATGLSLPSSDVDLVVCLPPVRNLEPIKEAGILEGRNGIKETCLQHAARYLTNQEWVKSDSLKIVENTAIPIIMLVVEVPHDLISSSNMSHTPKEEVDQATCEEGNSTQTDGSSSEGSASPKWSTIMNNNNGFKSVRLDISFKSPTHTGLQTTGLVKDLTERFPAVTPLALVLKQFLADRSLDQSYSGGLSSYCLILLITRLLQHEHHHGRPISQNYGSLLMDFLYFFGNVFDPRQMRISVQGSGVYLKRERGCSIDPLCIDDPLISTNNVGRNCFRVHQCIKAFADAYEVLQHEVLCLIDNDDADVKRSSKLLPKIIPSISQWLGA